MSIWIHAMCYECWDKRHPDEPVERNNTGVRDTCCFCGSETQSGIYSLREDIQDLPPHCSLRVKA